MTWSEVVQRIGEFNRGNCDVIEVEVVLWSLYVISWDLMSFHGVSWDLPQGCSNLLEVNDDHKGDAWVKWPPNEEMHHLRGNYSWLIGDI